MLTKEMEYHPVYRLKEMPGYFMSRAKALLILLAFVSLVIVLIVLAVMLAQQKGTQGKVCEGKDDPTGKWKCEAEVNESWAKWVNKSWVNLHILYAVSQVGVKHWR